MFDTRFTRKFGIRHPIAQAPMERSAPPELAAAVSQAGGHVRSSIALLPLLFAVLDVAGTTPVIAAGGIANGRGLAAGGAGVWMGTRF